jgi:hypothetical protein
VNALTALSGTGAGGVLVSKPVALPPEWLDSGRIQIFVVNPSASTAVLYLLFLTEGSTSRFVAGTSVEVVALQTGVLAAGS